MNNKKDVICDFQITGYIYSLFGITCQSNPLISQLSGQCSTAKLNHRISNEIIVIST